MEEEITNRIKKAIEEQVFPGCVVGVVYRNGTQVVLPFGNFSYEQNSPKIKTDSIFDVASITKSIPASSLALQLIDQGKIKLDDKVVNFISEVQNDYKNRITVRHLLTYALDFDLRLSEHKDKSPDEILNLIYTARLKNPPGTNFAYANATSILLGILIERVTGQKLDHLASSYFFKPLKMERTTFYPEKFDKNEIVPTEIDDWRGRVIQGEVHDESAWKLRSKLVVGSAGLFSTVPDLLNFLGTHLRGADEGARLLDRRGGVAPAVHLGDDSYIGWESYEPRYMGNYCSENTFGKTGFTGCAVICDPEKGIGLTILSNYTYPKRKPDSKLINEVRKDIADIVFNYPSLCFSTL